MKSGTVAIIGKPNVGKSTILNAITGSKISIVSKHPATTRFRIIGVKTTDSYQIVFVDTPGIEKTRNRLGEIMQNNITAAIEDADIIVIVLDATHIDSEDERIIQQINTKIRNKKIIVALNKIDRVKPRTEVLSIIDRLTSHYNLKEIVPCSALTGENISEIERVIAENLSEGELIFPKDYTDTFPQTYKISEIIREKVFEHVYQEIPHSIAVEVEEIKPGDKNPDMVVITATIVVEKDNQKKIVIGKNGEKLKIIGSKARREIELMLGKKVYLQLRVKTIEKWRDRPDIFGRFGYGSI
ncbi:MAG: GTPase Era [candidate division TA06 bacterium ADurb.Bin131]|jgi:GTP-binding protein Era|uniref:GTPase Era n=1 Tax=candidate division TA06 bacterium ADurb.Bin131 TaxID=1852827 RepID=A0A1V6C8J9_UNCT6|nr:MAG: GTPase Era [candidate division TA06 bacterium ADurb.Bin131]